MSKVIVLLLSYLFGSIPWALVIGLVFYKKDIRKEGSGNLGGTNAGRVLGKKAGVSVVALDVLKAFLSMVLAHYLAPGTEIYAGLACCVGHCFPIFAHFKGGKAVSTSIGFLLGISIFISHEYFFNLFFPVICFFGILYLFRMVSLSSICTFIIATITSFILYLNGRNDSETVISLLILTIFITYRHSANIKRILNHTESHIKWMGKELWGK